MRDPAPRPLAVIFDYDGVLVNSMPAHVAAWQQAFRRCIETDVPVTELYSREGEARKRTVLDLFKLVAGRAPDSRQVDQIIAWRDSYYRSHPTRLFPHVRRLLASLQKQHVALAVVSGNIEVARELRERHIDQFFSVVISPSDASHMKPHPAPYLAAVARLRLPPTRCIVVENSPLGIRAARRASLFCVAVKGNSPLSAQTLRTSGAAVVFNSIAGLRAFVDAGGRRGRGISEWCARAGEIRNG